MVRRRAVGCPSAPVSLRGPDIGREGVSDHIADVIGDDVGLLHLQRVRAPWICNLARWQVEFKIYSSSPKALSDHQSHQKNHQSSAIKVAANGE